MKKVLTTSVLSLFAVSQAFAQQNSDRDSSTTSLTKKLNILEKKTAKFNLYFNFQSSFDVQNTKSEGTEALFKARQLRLEMKGDLTDKLFYRFRHRLNRSNSAETLDNLAKATDIIYAGYHINNQFSVMVGKLAQSLGSFEYDLNSINIYEFSDFGNNLDCFQVGIDVGYAPNKNHDLHLEITDSRNSRFQKLYEDATAIKASKAPLSYILNWNGNFADQRFQTRWSFSTETEAKNKYSYMLMLGNKLNFNKFQIALDYMFAKQDLDRLNIATNAVRDADLSNEYIKEDISAFENVTYSSLVAKAEFQPHEKWNLFAQGMYETSSVKDVPKFDNNFRKSYGYFGGVEFLPFNDQDLRIFLAYVGRKVDYNKDIPGLKDTYSNRVSLGIMYRIKVF